MTGVGLGDANGKSVTSCSLGVTIKSLPCVQQRFPDHSLCSDKVFKQLETLTLCLQMGRSWFRPLWHVTLNTSNPTLTKLVSYLKYFANTRYFHNFYFPSSVCIHIHKNFTWGAARPSYLQSRETGSVPEAAGEEQAEKPAWAFESMAIIFFHSFSCLLAQWWFHSIHAESGFSLVSTAPHIWEYFFPFDSMKMSSFPSHLSWESAPCGSELGSGQQLLI